MFIRYPQMISMEDNALKTQDEEPNSIEFTKADKLKARILNHTQPDKRPHRIDAPEEPKQIKKAISLEAQTAIKKTYKEITNNGLAETTTKPAKNALKQIAKNKHLFNPEEVKNTLKKHDKRRNRRTNTNIKQYKKQIHLLLRLL